MNYQEKCRWLANLYGEAAKTGRAIQYAAAEKWVTADEGPSLSCRIEDYRIEPEPPKAWVVWDDEGWRKITKIKPDAERFAESINGTIQEITRPESQVGEPRPVDTPEWLEDMKASRAEHAEVRKILKHRISLGEALSCWLSNTEAIIERLDSAIAKAEGRGESANNELSTCFTLNGCCKNTRTSLGMLAPPRKPA